MFLEISFPQSFVYGKSRRNCVGWSGDWTELSTFAIHLGEVDEEVCSKNAKKLFTG